MKPEELKEILLKVIRLQQEIVSAQHELFILMNRVGINEKLIDDIQKYISLKETEEKINSLVVERKKQRELKEEFKNDQRVMAKNLNHLKSAVSQVVKDKEKFEKQRKTLSERISIKRKELAKIRKEKYFAGKCHRCTIMISEEFSYNRSIKYPTLCRSCGIRTDEEKGIVVEKHTQVFVTPSFSELSEERRRQKREPYQK